MGKPVILSVELRVLIQQEKKGFYSLGSLKLLIKKEITFLYAISIGLQ